MTYAHQVTLKDFVFERKEETVEVEQDLWVFILSPTYNQVIKGK